MTLKWNYTFWSLHYLLFDIVYLLKILTLLFAFVYTVLWNKKTENTDS